jgi:hypothetical protein
VLKPAILLDQTRGSSGWNESPPALYDATDKPVGRAKLPKEQAVARPRWIATAIGRDLPLATEGPWDLQMLLWIKASGRPVKVSVDPQDTFRRPENDVWLSARHSGLT